MAFLLLTESKLKNWTVKYGREERVQHLMNQYRTFVSKNKIFQEFHKAYVEFKEVSDEYKRDGQMEPGESDQIDRFIREVSDRWKNTSTELRCVQSLLEEVHFVTIFPIHRSISSFCLKLLYQLSLI